MGKRIYIQRKTNNDATYHIFHHFCLNAKLFPGDPCSKEQLTFGLKGSVWMSQSNVTLWAMVTYNKPQTLLHPIGSLFFLCSLIQIQYMKGENPHGLGTALAISSAGSSSGSAVDLLPKLSCTAAIFAFCC